MFTIFSSLPFSFLHSYFSLKFKILPFRLWHCWRNCCSAGCHFPGNEAALWGHHVRWWGSTPCQGALWICRHLQGEIFWMGARVWGNLLQVNVFPYLLDDILKTLPRLFIAQKTNWTRFYFSSTAYEDDLVWSALWLYKATGENTSSSSTGR